MPRPQSDEEWLEEYSAKPMPKAKSPVTKFPKDDEEEGTEAWGKQGSGKLGGPRGARQKRFIEGIGGMGVGRN